MKVKKLSDELNSIKNSIMSSSLIPVLGSGFSVSMLANEGLVPSGNDMKTHMINTLSKLDASYDFKSKSFSQLAKYYNKKVSLLERKEYFLKNFTKVKLSRLCTEFLSINWPYIYTLNIDDAIERNSEYIPVGPNREFDEEFESYEKRVYKLHGDVQEIISLKDGDRCYIFDSDQYVDSLEDNKWILEKVKQDYLEKNILFLGCSLDDELDLRKVFSVSKKEKAIIQTEKYYVTDKALSEYEVLDLESYGVTTVILVDTYDEFYETIVSIKTDIEKMTLKNEIESFKNIPVSILSNKDETNKDYILHEKMPFNKKERKIYLPYFFISRQITDDILQDMNDNPLQIIYGKRVSGKSYILLDLARRLKDRDVYYFDSRSKVNIENLDYLFKKQKTTILLDTQTLSIKTLNYIFNYNLSDLLQKQINVILCINTSRKEEVFELRAILDNPYAKAYYVINNFSGKDGKEHEDIKKKMSSINLPYFSKNRTIIDGVLWIQKQLSRSTNGALSDFNISKDNYMQLAYLILMANYGKVTTSSMRKFDLQQEPYQLMNKLEKAIEPDFRNVFMFDGDTSRFQIVCNAQAWLLGYLSSISVREEYFDSFVCAFHHIVEKINKSYGDKNRIRKELFEFIRFDNINLLLGSARNEKHSVAVRKLIQAIYTDLKLFLGEDYQFNHQHAKCILWGIEALPEEEREKEINKAISTISLTIEQIEEAKETIVNKTYINKSLAHAHFTSCMIRVKHFLLYPTVESFQEAVRQTCQAISCRDNWQAIELYDAQTDDIMDYSVSQFMDNLIAQKYTEYADGLRSQINQIANFRIRMSQNKVRY